MAINFKEINLEIIDINTNATPDIFINANCVTFSKRVLEDLNYPQHVQYGIDAEHRVFAIRACKGNEVKATPFSKPRGEQTTTLSCFNKNMRDTVCRLISNYNPKARYKVVGYYDAENRTLYFDMSEAEKSFYRASSNDEK